MYFVSHVLFLFEKKSIKRIYVILNIFLKYLDIWTLLPVFINGIFINRKTSRISLINFSEVIHEVHRVKTQIINQCNPHFAFPFYTSYKDIFSTMLEIQSNIEKSLLLSPITLKKSRPSLANYFFQSDHQLTLNGVM